MSGALCHALARALPGSVVSYLYAMHDFSVDGSSCCAVCVCVQSATSTITSPVDQSEIASAAAAVVQSLVAVVTATEAQGATAQEVGDVFAHTAAGLMASLQAQAAEAMMRAQQAVDAQLADAQATPPLAADSPTEPKKAFTTSVPVVGQAKRAAQALVRIVETVAGAYAQAAHAQVTPHAQAAQQPDLSHTAKQEVTAHELCDPLGVSGADGGSSSSSEACANPSQTEATSRLEAVRQCEGFSEHEKHAFLQFNVFPRVLAFEPGLSDRTTRMMRKMPNGHGCLRLLYPGTLALHIVGMLQEQSVSYLRSLESQEGLRQEIQTALNLLTDSLTTAYCEEYGEAYKDHEEGAGESKTYEHEVHEGEGEDNKEKEGEGGDAVAAPSVVGMPEATTIKRDSFGEGQQGSVSNLPPTTMVFDDNACARRKVVLNKSDGISAL